MASSAARMSSHRPTAVRSATLIHITDLHAKALEIDALRTRVLARQAILRPLALAAINQRLAEMEAERAIQS